MKSILYFALSLLLFTAFAQAADLDDEVTDVKLRAKSGSKSKWSGSLSLNYYGASLAEPFGDERPNVAGEGNPMPVTMSGNMGLRYRLDTYQSLYLATGLAWSKDSGKGLEVSNPLFMYNKTFTWKDVQLSHSFILNFYTQKNARDFGSVGGLSYDLSALKSLGKSRFSVGVSISPFFSFYDKKVAYQTDYGISISPSLQFQVSDKWNLFTMISPLSYSHLRENSDWNFDRFPTTQSFGAGIALFRNFYLSPSVFFRPNDISDDNTAINISAYINMF